MNDRTRTVPPPQIPLAFLCIALAALFATLVWTLAGDPAPLAVLHALVLGVFSMVAMGLLYQFVPVVAMSPLRWPHAAFLHLVLAATAALAVVAGFQLSNFAAIRLGGWLELCGLAIQIAVLGATVARRRPPAAALGAMLSLAWLLLAVAIGTWMADRLVRGHAIGDAAHDHALAGLAGFFGTLIAAVTFRLLRMFERVDVEARTPFLALCAAAAALAAIVLGRVGNYAILAAALAVGVNFAAIVRARNPAYQRETLAYGALSAAGAIAAAAANAAGDVVAATVITVWYFVGAAVSGYLQRIVPFIWWIRRARREGAQNIPTLAQMNDSRIGYAVLALWALAGGMYFVDRRLAAGIGLAAWTGLTVQLLRPFVLRKRRTAGTGGEPDTQ